MGLTVSRPEVHFSASVNGKPLNPARLAWAAAMMACLGFTVFYSIAAPFFSGQRVTNLELQSASALQLPGITFTKSGPRQETVGPVALDPTMNRVGLVLHVGHRHVSSMERLSCQITVRDESGRVVWEGDRPIVSGRIGRSAAVGGAISQLTAMFGTLSVPQADKYSFEVRFTSQYSDVVRSANLEIRRNVTGASRSVILFGLGVGLASLLGFILSGRSDDDEQVALPRAA
jgi:hypothetical protein